ncbi:PepSY-associated TM helix domain-containing protein [Acanthopleuribacter pedis]|uniref:PepSY domain-containing protein n=1 Tax=Acanthopleuribacter pedis TaxID=442870 RepID=A0A8J7Q3Q1_9BACT|nr:PepSY-associated TM helix domain-containing protein [Acanthopleuribacter pedis]MBO1317502.1 PepSY domain-containing protein [Acanthopleuribacter pedis]
MNQRNRKIMLETHAWAGLILGVLLFVICFSGSVAMFVGELGAWTNPHLRRAYNPAPFSLEARYQDARAAGLTQPNVFIAMPSPAQPYLSLATFHNGEHQDIHIDPHTGELLPTHHAEISEFLGHLHTDLHLPYPLGRYSIGLSGIFLLLLLVTGFLIHRKRWSELWLTRPTKTRRMWLTDIHKVLGTWGLPFTLVIAFTGAILGLLGFLGPFMALATYNGDVDAATQAFSGPPAQRTEQPAPMMSLDTLRERVLSDDPSMDIQYVSLREYGDGGAQIEFNGPARETLTYQNAFVFSGADGALLHRVNWNQGGVWHQLFGMVTPLHFGSFGGPLLKWLYFLLGLSLTALCATGTMIWLEKRLHQKHGAAPSTNRYARFAMGVCGGLPTATAVLFLTHALLAGDAPYVAFWLTWLGVVLLAWFGPTPAQLTLPLTAANAATAWLIPLVNGLATGDFLWRSYRELPYVFAVDAVFFLIGLTLWVVLQRRLWPSTRPAQARVLTPSRES